MPMYIISRDGLAYEGTVTSPGYWDFWVSCQFQQSQRVACGQIDMNIAADGSDGLKLYLG